MPENTGATGGCGISNPAWWTFPGKHAIIAAKKGAMHMKLSEQIVRLRTRLGLTQGDLAGYIAKEGMSRSRVPA